MSFNDIFVGDYGQVFTLTFLDVDTSAAADVSGYDDTQVMIITDPSGNDTTLTAAWGDDGTDGVITYTVAENLIDEAGEWTIRGRVTDTGNKVLTTTKHHFKVKE